jgi:general secretion pathway protein E
VATSDTAWGETAVLRVLDRSIVLLELSQLGFQVASLNTYHGMLQSPFGMILISGPTGSGKTTTLYASIDRLNREEVNIMTIEDPIEYNFRGINQIQVNRLAGMDFATGLRAILRLDPDVILVGEIRDSETAETAVNAALTGHLVLSSVHSSDAVGALFRLLDLGVEPFALVSAVIGVVAQRLVRRVCSRCRAFASPPPEEQFAYEKEMGEPAPRLYYGEGCNFCAGTGYRGRTGVFEVLAVSEEIRRLLLKGASASQVKAQALKEGIIPMWRDGMMKVKEGITTPYEVIRNVYTLG